VSTNSTATVTRIAQALPEARLDHSQSEFARLSGAKVEAGRRVHPALLVRLGATIVVLDAYREPRFDDDVDVMLREGLQAAS
jgi:hypothetical protein